MELVRSSISIVSGLPCEKVRSAPAIVVSGPAQRSLMLWPARSRSRLATLSIESSDSFVASTAVSIATGWSEPVPGREFHPLKSSAFHGALFRQLRDSNLPICPYPDPSGFLLRTWTSKANSIGTQPMSINGRIKAMSLNLDKKRKPALPNSPPTIGMHENPTCFRQACAMPT
jgi:hypothetical protein